MVAEAEKKLGYKFPQSYIDLMKSRNGGKLIKNYWVNEYAKSNEVDVIGLECFYSIGSEKDNSLFGKFGNEFWFDDIYKSYKADGDKLGKNTIVTSAGVAGSWVGAIGGAKVGAGASIAGREGGEAVAEQIIKK